ncbi:NAD(P)-binding domain-containing protein, partial [Patescibacteria group bacterium]|nr:NAD(P)-binding domain-containing protein [Patescibacteria group bacterium]
MKIGYIGLGRMGKNMVLRLLEQGIEVVAWNRSPEPREELKEEVKEIKTGSENLTIVESLNELIEKLETPRVIWLMISAGGAIDAVLSQLTEKLSKEDLVIDGGNSFYKDTLRRNEMLSQKGIHFMDAGTSGGIEGARGGACIMAGGSLEDFKRAEPIFKAAAKPEAYAHLGSVGSGHFAKTNIS